MKSSLYDWQQALEISKIDPQVNALIMAACMKADSDNMRRLELGFPELVREARERWNAPGGRIGHEAAQTNIVRDYNPDTDTIIEP